MNSDTSTHHQTSKSLGFPFRRLASDYKYGFGLNVICALIITFVMNSIQYFWANLLASMCVGTIGFLIIDGIRLSFWRDGARPHWAIMLLLVLCTAPLAQIAGLTLSFTLLGQDTSAMLPVTSPKMVGLILFTLMAICSAILFFSSREKMIRLEKAAAEEKARVERVERQALQAQLQLLQAQIEPHMLFNTLANLQGLIGFDPERAQLLLDQLIQYLRATLSSSRAASTTLGQEFALMEAYLGLMSVRMGQRLSYKVELPAELRALSLPPMLLQPLVENAIQHGLEPKIDGGHIDVRAVREGDLLVLNVSDNGLGLALPAPAAKPGGHVGLSNIRERLQALYGDRARLQLDPAPLTGAIARLTLPLETP